jgi:type VI secretion system protein ImpF
MVSSWRGVRPRSSCSARVGFFTQPSADRPSLDRMAKVENTDPLIPSVLDRLLDDEPSSQQEQPQNRFQLLRTLKQSVRRDLENLLNTRWRCVGWPADLEELETSLVNYGIPDFTGANLGSAVAREEFVRIIQETIRRFEPRLTRVKLEMLDNAEREDRTMRFRIDAVLQVDPDPEPVSFDSRLEPSSGNFRVSTSGGGEG